MSLSPELLSAFERVPVNKTLGFRLESRTEKETRISMPALDAYVQEEGVIQGGVLIALADTAAVYIVYPDLEEGKTMTSIESKINYLRPALPGDEAIVAHAQLVKRGRKVSVCEVEIYQRKRLIAKATFTYLMYEKVG